MISPLYFKLTLLSTISLLILNKSF
jgi:hypothetical protein